MRARAQQVMNNLSGLKRTRSAEGDPDNDQICTVITAPLAHGVTDHQQPAQEARLLADARQCIGMQVNNYLSESPDISGSAADMCREINEIYRPLFQYWVSEIPCLPFVCLAVPNSM